MDKSQRQWRMLLRKYLINLTAWGVFKWLRMRRGLPMEGFAQVEAYDTTLQLLRDGQRVFNTSNGGQAAAGVPNQFFPSVQQYQQLDLLRDQATPGIFSNRRPQQSVGPY